MTLTTIKQYIDSVSSDSNAVTTGETSTGRTLLTSSNVLASGMLYITYFTAKKSQQINTIKIFTGASGSAGATLCRIGLLTVSANGDIVDNNSTPSDTSMWTTAFTGYSKNFFSTWNKAAGLRYAIQVLFTGTTPPTFIVENNANNAAINSIMASSPRVAGQISGRSDILSGTTADASISAGSTRIYMEFS